MLCFAQWNYVVYINMQKAFKSRTLGILNEHCTVTEWQLLFCSCEPTFLSNTFIYNVIEPSEVQLRLQLIKEQVSSYLMSMLTSFYHVCSHSKSLILQLLKCCVFLFFSGVQEMLFGFSRWNVHFGCASLRYMCFGQVTKTEEQLFASYSKHLNTKRLDIWVIAIRTMQRDCKHHTM